MHYNEAKITGIELTLDKKPYVLSANKLVGKPNEKLENITDPVTQFKLCGYWTSNDFLPGMYLNIIQDDTPLNPNEYMCEFRGLIATGRVCWESKYSYGKKKSGITFITIGCTNGKYVDITIPVPVNYHPFDIVTGTGILTSTTGQKVKWSSNTNKIIVSTYKFELIGLEKN